MISQETLLRDVVVVLVALAAGYAVGSLPIARAVARAAGHDVLVVSGGVSVGPHDHVKPAFEACGVEELFWRVRVKPGKPLWFGRRGSTLVFGLPGNPLSSIVGFLAFIEPALRRMHGEPDASMRTVPARLTTDAGPSDGRTTFLTSRLVPGPDGVLEVEAKYTLKAEDGTLIMVDNRGLRHGPAAVLDRIAKGEAVDPKDYYFRTTAQFEAPADSKYAWTNRAVFVGVAQRKADAAVIRFYRVD